MRATVLSSRAGRRAASTVAYEYRKHSNSPRKKRVSSKPPEFKLDLPPGFTVLPRGSWRGVKPPTPQAPVPNLAHGLDAIVSTRGLYPVRDIFENKYSFPASLETIDDPKDVDFDALPPFMPPSQDETLHRLSKKEGLSVKGSTSSFTPVLSLLYHAISGYKGINVGLLKTLFKEGDRYYRNSLRPVTVMLRPRDNVFAVDSHADWAKAPNVLMHLGKQLERMLTMEPEEFRARMLRGDEPKPRLPMDTYNYLRYGDMLLRSQLDCVSTRTGDVFDIKTRAVLGVRLNVDRYREYLDYKLDKLWGEFNSYEREFYDLMRGAFLKYAFQVRIGMMSGVLMMYHNTSTVFGFEYISIEDIDEACFGSTACGEQVFDATLGMFNVALKAISSYYGHSTPLMVTVDVRNSMVMDRFVHFYVEPVESDAGWKENGAAVAAEGTTSLQARTGPRTIGAVAKFTVRMRTFCNGVVQWGAMEPVNEGDRLDVVYELSKPDTGDSVVGEYTRVLEDRAWR